MNVLMISSDRGLLDTNSSVYLRHSELARRVGHITIILFSREGMEVGSTQHLRVIPTVSRSRWLYIYDAYRTARNVRKQGFLPDIITVQDPFEIGLAGLCIAKLFRAPLQVQVHTDIFSPYFSVHSRLNKVRQVLAPYVLRRAQGVRVVSQRIADSIIKIVRSSPIPDVLPVFIDTTNVLHGTSDFLAHKYPAHKKFILTVARFEPEKNVRLALDVFALVCAKVKDVAFVIVGDGSQKNALVAHARFLGIAHRVYFCQPERSLKDYYASAHAVLITSQYEGFSLVAAESGFVGVPVVMSDVGLAGSIFKDNDSAFVCPVGDKDCLFEKTLKILHNDFGCEKMTAHAQRALSAVIVNSDDYFRKYISLWEKTIKQGETTAKREMGSA